MLSSSSPTWQTSLLSSTRNNNYPEDDLPIRSSASLIVPRLYLSNYFVAKNEEQLCKMGITHVISVFDHDPPKYTTGLKTLHISLVDTFDTNILQHLDATTDFIKSALSENEENKVLVHCLMGISRSATVVCAYLCATSPMTAEESIDFVISKRSIVCPNLGFRMQLDTYATRFYTGGLKLNHAARTTRSVSSGIADRVRRLRSNGQS